MGCDIHAFIEYKKYDYWRNFGKEHRLDRSYNMFGLMAEVRQEEIALYVPRGLPKDVDYETEEAWKEDGGHSSSWLTLGEFERCINKFTEIFEQPPDNDYIAARDAMRVLGESRLVFWFDN